MPDQMIRCPSCGAMNRIRAQKPGTRVVCGKCKATLVPSTGGTLPVTDSDFAEKVERSPLPVLLDLWADWCGPCHMLAPVVEQLSSELAGRVTVAKLNIDENPSTAARFGVRSIPTLLLLKNGREVDRIVGVQPKQVILQRVNALLH